MTSGRGQRSGSAVHRRGTRPSRPRWSPTSTPTTTRPSIDALALKLPMATTMADRVRMNTCAWRPLRSVRGRCSGMPAPTCCGRSRWTATPIDSGDWFNRIDWTGVATLSARGCRRRWTTRRNGHSPATAGQPGLRPGPADIAAARAAAHDLLRLRYSSPLFRLRCGGDRRAGLRFRSAARPDRRGDPHGVLTADAVGSRGSGPDRGGLQRLPVVARRPGRRPAVLILHPVQVAGAIRSSC